MLTPREKQTILAGDDVMGLFLAVAARAGDNIPKPFWDAFVSWDAAARAVAASTVAGQPAIMPGTWN